MFSTPLAEESLLADKITISGAIEIKVDSASIDSESEQDLVTATVEVGIDAEINENVAGSIVLLHERGRHTAFRG